ncbi:hypothetical protein H4696_007591 [Amycolatopsis lexingtonensis]|uniref:Uncharacterized protein n=1 Tax=Amycolatopsis lexingtonensis TaxID=218822 RepID=A0ABR9IBD1_9PSEU|nr:DUF6338 family protein [Amycolatopsis lexingtonensis]MBE1500491.1 hypothetical protein [Amycolatopsis lexingtonensis]
MIPSTWLAVVLFLIVVAPGLFFDLLGARRRVEAAESAFREIGRVALGSLGFTLVTLLLLLGVRWVFPRLLFDPKSLILGGSAYLAEHYGQVVLTIVAATVVSHAFAFGLHKWLARRQGETYRKISVWGKAFRDGVPPGHAVFVRVRLSSGLVYTGQVENFTADLPMADRELLLRKPLAAKLDADSALSPLPDVYDRVVLRGSEIDVISVEYRRVPPSAGKKRLQRSSTQNGDTGPTPLPSE